MAAMRFEQVQSFLLAKKAGGTLKMKGCYSSFTHQAIFRVKLLHEQCTVLKNKKFKVQNLN